MRERRVCLVGAGYIAHVHAEILRQMPRTSLAAIVDTNKEAAHTFAERWRVPAVYDSVNAAIAVGDIHCAHILTPPDTHHAAAEVFLAAGLPVLVEKPLATSSADCRHLVSLATDRRVTLAVNQNYIFHPAFTRLHHMVAQRTLGRLAAVQVTYSMPLRQLATRQFQHWMFRAPLNILLEQAVHPLSEIMALVGAFEKITAVTSSPVEIAPGKVIFNQCSIAIVGKHAHALLSISVGSSLPYQQVVAICDDGVIVAALQNNRIVPYARTRCHESVDMLVSGISSAFTLGRESVSNARDSVLSLIRLKSRVDPFFLAMKASVASFHEALNTQTQPVHHGGFGAALVEACERIAAAAFGEPRPLNQDRLPVTSAKGADICLIGGTGFIGAASVKAFTKAGFSVAVMARSIGNLPPEFWHPKVRILQGDVRRAQDVERAVAGVPVVVNLAHGGGGGSWSEIQRTMVDSAELVANACLSLGAKRLLHVGSIAALYLGDGHATITGQSPVDAKAEERSDYARGKAMVDRMLLRMHAVEKLSVVILRPGMVVGDGAAPFHGGLGAFHNEQHCLGWSRGDHPLPFVLVEDVAAAILHAASAPGIDGHCYNLVGDVRLSAREYIRELAEVLERPLRFHPQSTIRLHAIEILKWAVKRVAGRAAPFPRYRELRSRGLFSRFDCTDAKTDLDWSPEADRSRFIERAIRVQSARREEL